MISKTIIRHLNKRRSGGRVLKRYSGASRLYSLKQCLDIMNDCEVLTREYVLLMEQHSRDCVSENRYVASLRGLVAQYRELIVRYDKVVNDFNNGVVNVQRAKGDADTMYQSLMDIRNSLEEKYTLMMNVYQVSLLLQAAEQATAALPPNDSCG